MKKKERMERKREERERETTHTCELQGVSCCRTALSLFSLI
jgi:hypothetical protein